MTSDEWAEAIISLNQSYVMAVAELCRRQPDAAGFYLNMSSDDVEAFARFRPAELVRLQAIPIAIASPVAGARQLLAARSAEDILKPVQAAYQTHAEGKR
jgi:hypothetical protein